jgi:hypothetical protein
VDEPIALEQAVHLVIFAALVVHPLHAGESQQLRDQGEFVPFNLGRAPLPADRPLLLLSPLFLIMAILIKLDSPGPVLFLQRR